MTNMQRLLCLLTLFMPLLGYTQPNDALTQVVTGTSKSHSKKGIQWTTGLTWEQIKQKAKEENKYIFLDCYTTWCPPCKKMDQVVYPDQEVGEFFNSRFISVKVQMDKTKNDDAIVKSWYAAAAAIEKQFRVDAYPTLLFISPEGVPTEKEAGFKEIPQLISLAQGALKPGKVYSDPYAEYDKLVKDYKNGIKHYEKMVGMIQVAEKRKEEELANKLFDEYIMYVAKLPKENRYTKDAIKLWTSRVIKSTDKQFQFFYKDGVLIDKISEWDGLSNDIVDNVMQNEVIEPFFKKQPGGDKLIQHGHGFMMMDAFGNPIRQKEPPPDVAEADWKSLEKDLKRRFNKYWAKRGILNAKMIWYKGHHNWMAFANIYLQKLKSYGVDGWVNNHAFDIFLQVDDKNILNQLAFFVDKAITKYSGGSAEIDTYANLLYRAGRITEAITWESKAAELAGEYNAYYLMIVEKMKKGESTWD